MVDNSNITAEMASLSIDQASGSQSHPSEGSRKPYALPRGPLAVVRAEALKRSDTEVLAFLSEVLPEDKEVPCEKDKIIQNVVYKVGFDLTAAEVRYYQDVVKRYDLAAQFDLFLEGPMGAAWENIQAEQPDNFDIDAELSRLVNKYFNPDSSTPDTNGGPATTSASRRGTTGQVVIGQGSAPTDRRTVSENLHAVDEVTAAMDRVALTSSDDASDIPQQDEH